MNCLQAEEHFSAHFEDTLDYQTLQGFEGHLAECETCQHEYARFQESVKATQQLPQLEPSPYFMPALLQRLAEEKRETGGVKGIVTGWKRLLDAFRRPVWAISGAMMLILATAGTYFYQEGFLFDQDSSPTVVTPTSQEAQIGTRPPVRNRNGFLPNSAISTRRQPMQQHYILKQVSYTNASTSGGL